MHNNLYKTEKEISFTNDLMVRIRTVRRFRAFMASPAASALLAGIFLLCGSIFVSIGDVIQNIMAQGEWGGRFSYAYSALMHSRFVVQALALLMMISCTMVFVRSFRLMRTPLFAMGNFIASISPIKFLRS